MAVAATTGRQRVVRGAALNQPAGANWAGNVTFAATGVARPRTVAEVQEIVADAARRGERVHAVGARHSFTAVGDTDGVLVDTDALREVGAVDETAATVTVGAGIRYAELAPYLDERGWALGNLPSLPHVSVAGAVATATHGSGDSNPVLADAVRAVDLVTAPGERRRLERGDPDAAAAIVGLGAFGVITHVTLGLVPRFDVAQDVYVDVPFEDGLERLDELLASAYSVSLFTDWSTGTFHQVWRKRRTTDALGADAVAGLTAARQPVHPIRGLPPDACTIQLGRPGPWHERLVHFRADATPSAGDELQSEYLVARADAPDAVRAVGALAAALAPLVLVSEVRSVAADDLWISPAYGRSSVAIHFTWRRDLPAVTAMLPAVEAALAPFDPRPHWAKLATMRRSDAFARLADWAAARDRVDPGGTFGNRFIDALRA